MSIMYARLLPARPLAWVACLIALTHQPAHAGGMYSFSGTIATADPSTGIAAGTQFHGTFSFDPAAQPTDIMRTPAPSGMDTASYTRTNGPPYAIAPGMTLTVGGQTLIDATDLAVASNTRTSPEVQVSASGLINGALFRGALDLLDPVGIQYGMFGPISSLDLSHFSGANLEATNSNTAEVLFTGTITSLTAVPEPAHVTLACLAAGGLVGVHRRRKGLQGRGTPGAG
ncbi:hypothetical protein [Singulisphaera sp. PoT]|uniref:hypothetical protein n=1 Tax=Singulisphaera sp. PoT TaxID=3411797 RepID=UPI003BF4EB15